MSAADDRDTETADRSAGDARAKGIREQGVRETAVRATAVLVNAAPGEGSPHGEGEAPEGPAVAPGEVIAGTFRVERLLGEGGMGHVHEATDIHLRRTVAIKTLDRSALARADLRERFLREARALARLSQSEHVARILGYGEAESGTPYIVMEHLRGVDLGEELSAHGPLAPDEAVRLALQACEALADAHAVGIVHRDLKPSNLFLTEDRDGERNVVLLDFGIAHLPPEGDSDVRTRTNAFLGSLPFAAPEHMRSAKQADERSDVWSLGVTLYQMLTGKLPFKVTTLPGGGVSVDREPPLSPSRVRRGLPDGLDAVVMACLEEDREQRIPDVAVLARALLPFAPPGMEREVERIERRLGAVPAAAVPGRTRGRGKSAATAGVAAAGAPAGREVSSATTTTAPEAAAIPTERPLAAWKIAVIVIATAVITAAIVLAWTGMDRSGSLAGASGAPMEKSASPAATSAVAAASGAASARSAVTSANGATATMAASATTPVTAVSPGNPKIAGAPSRASPPASPSLSPAPQEPAPATSSNTAAPAPSKPPIEVNNPE